MVCLAWRNFWVCYSAEKGILQIQLTLALLSFSNAGGNVQATATNPGPYDLRGPQFQCTEYT